MSATTATVAGYILTYSDDVYEGPSILPSAEAMPRVIYKTIDDAEKALEGWKKRFDSFIPVLYGEVYPYDTTTAREQIAKKGFAIYGWTTDTSVDYEPVRYGVYILEVRWAAG